MPVAKAGEGGILINSNDHKIQWQFFKKLQDLQEKEGLSLGNKLKSAHINWYQQIMKVNLAAQTFSASVADAIEYCGTVLKLKQFEGCKATVHFIRIIDRLFNVLNSRNPFAKGFKSALQVSNQTAWKPFLEKPLAFLLQ